METDNMDNETKLNSEQTDEKPMDVYLLPDGIPKSPHLGKDFSPSGERIHNSMRARRRQRTLQAQNASHHQHDDEDQQHSTDQVLQAVKDSLQLQEAQRGMRRKADRGFVLDISRSGILNINNVRDLNNLSDLDSSCDTSLNYHEVNNMEETQTTTTTTNDAAASKAADVKDSNLKTIQETDDSVDGGFKTKTTITNTRPTIPFNNQKTNPIISITQEEDTQTAMDTLHHVKHKLAEKSYKSALEDIRTRLNLCKTKFDSIDEANRKNFNNSQNSMRSFFKVQKSTEDVYKAPPDTYKMFSTLKSTNANANTNTSTTDRQEEFRKTYRVNQTPVFGRKQSQTITIESYKSHSDSLENLDKIGRLTFNGGSSKLDKKELSPPKRAKLPKERTFKSYITSLEVQPAECMAELPTKKENINTSSSSTSNSSSIGSKLKVSNNLLGLRKTLNFSSPTRHDTETKSFSRRTLSPTKSSEAKRVVKQEIPTSE